MAVFIPVIFVSNYNVVNAANNIDSQTDSEFNPTEDENWPVSQQKYMNNVSHLTSVDSEHVNKMISDKKAIILFVGYKECPYCRHFSKTLNQFQYDTHSKIYYYDLDKSEDNRNDKKLTKFLGLKYVPAIFLIRQGRIVVRYDGSQTNESQLFSLIEY